MRHNLAALIATPDDDHACEVWLSDHRRRFVLELDPHGLFLKLGSVEAYLCLEPRGSWSARREPGGFDARAGRLHLIVDRVRT